MEKKKHNSSEYQVSGDGKEIVINTTSQITAAKIKDSGGHENYIKIDVVNAPSIGASAFSGCNSLESIILSDSISSIGSHAFDKCRKLKSIVIPFKTTEILEFTFYECDNLECITIHENVNIIATSTCFRGCISLSKFEVSRSNLVFKTDDSKQYLMSINGQTLYAGTCGANTIPSKIRILSPCCLYWRGVTSVTFPEDSELVEIQKEVFGGTTLGVLLFPNKLERIETMQFYQSYVDEIIFPDSLVYLSDSFLDQIISIKKLTFNNETSKVLVMVDGVVYDRGVSTIFFVSELATSIAIPARVEQISQELVRRQTIESVEVLEGNANMSSYRGVLYDHKTEVLMACPGGRKVVEVAPTCKSFASGSFVRCLVETVIFTGYNFEEVGFAAFNYCYYLTTMELPISLKRIIGYAFELCTKWKGSIKLTNNITQLDEYAFNCCQSIELIDLSECDRITVLKTKTFKESGIKKIIFPPNIKSIQGSCFYKANQLESIEIPSTVSSISASAFSGCTSLRTAKVLSNSIPSLSDFLFENTGIASFDVPDSVTSIGSGCFRNCRSLNSINFGAKSVLSKVSPNMIFGCTSLKSIELPSSISDIQLDAFANGAGLQSILIRGRDTFSSEYWSDSGILMKGRTLVVCPGGRKSYSVNGSIESIASHAFYMCASLVTLEFTSTCILTTIADSTFYGCVSLQNLQLPVGLSSIERSAFNGCSGLVSVSFGDFSRVKSLGDWCFSGCSNLAQVDFGASPTLEEIGSGVFAGCKKLKLRRNSIPDSVLMIGQGCFENCSELEIESMSERIREIGNSCFRGCGRVASVRLPKTLEVLGADSFADCDSLYHVRFCGMTLPLGVSSEVFGGSSVSSVGVPLSFRGESFGGLPVRKVLDEKCFVPTEAFTGAPSEGLNLWLLWASVVSERSEEASTYQRWRE